MNKIKLILAASLLLFVSVQANAALFSRLGGQAVYNDVLDITWLADANLAASSTFGVVGIEPDSCGDGDNRCSNRSLADADACANRFGNSIELSFLKSCYSTFDVKASRARHVSMWVFISPDLNSYFKPIFTRYLGDKNYY